MALGFRHHLTAAVGDLARLPSVHRCDLGPLSRDAVAALLVGRGLDPDAVFEQTGGNPFFLSEVLRAPDEPVPASVRDAMIGRLGRLSEPARAAAEAAAVIGDPAAPALLEQVASGAADGVDECVTSGLLESVGAGVRFRHELARAAMAGEASRRQASVQRKRRIHPPV